MILDEQYVLSLLFQSDPALRGDSELFKGALCSFGEGIQTQLKVLRY